MDLILAVCEIQDVTVSVFGPMQLTAKRKTHDKRFLEENENKLVNISI